MLRSIRTKALLRNFSYVYSYHQIGNSGGYTHKHPKESTSVKLHLARNTYTLLMRMISGLTPTWKLVSKWHTHTALLRRRLRPACCRRRGGVNSTLLGFEKEKYVFFFLKTKRRVEFTPSPLRFNEVITVVHFQCFSTCLQRMRFFLFISPNSDSQFLEKRGKTNNKKQQPKRNEACVSMSWMKRFGHLAT